MMSDWLFSDALIEPTSISNDIQQQTAIGRNAFHYEYIYMHDIIIYLGTLQTNTYYHWRTKKKLTSGELAKNDT